MQILKLGIENPLVSQWKMFLQQQGFYNGSINNIFDAPADAATRLFQTQNSLEVDGKVGNNTFGKAMLLGLHLVQDDNIDDNSADFPPPPNFNPLVKNSQRQALFGTFAYVPNPTSESAENIKITDNWQRENIIEVSIPQIKKLKSSGTITFHKKAAVQLQKLWHDWETANLLDRILTYSGSFDRRFVRGSATTLSNHCFGSAFDINEQWNLRGRVPALLAQKGCVRELVTIANQNGFFWGGHYDGVKDGMHFEVAKIMSY